MNPPNYSWMPLLASLVGLLGGIIGVYLGNHLAQGRDLRMKVAEARMRRRQRWEEFEDQTLIEFQDKAPLFIGAIARLAMNASYVARFPKSADPDAFPRSITEVGEIHAIVFNFVTRIRDEEMRELAMRFLVDAKEVRKQAGLLITNSSPGSQVSPSALRPWLDEMHGAFLAVSGRIGERLRKAVAEEIAKSEAEEALEQARQSNSLVRRATRLADQVRARVREVGVDHA